MTPAKSFEQRWRITGILETTSPLHIGDGGITHRDELRAKEKGPNGAATGHSIDVSSVATDTSEKPYLPGRCLKDNVRAWVRSAIAGSHTELMNRVFGAEDDRGCAGRAEFWDARLDGKIADKRIPYWCKKRQTGVRSRTAIARRTKTVQKDKLFYIEYVPAGASFEVNISSQGLTEKEVAFLLFALDGFGNNANPEFRVRLGAAQDDFWGEMKWRERPHVKAILTQAQALEWSKKPDSVGYDGFFDLPKDVAERVATYKKSFTAASPEMVVIKLALHFDAPVLVNEPSATGKASDGLFSASAFRTPEGKLAIPADSFRGAFRSQAEKILRTQGLRACCVSDPNDACLPIETTEKKDKLCAACQSFGAPGWGTPLRISDFKETETSKSEIFQQEFVAVDRFGGGSADQFKFNAESRFGSTLEGKLVVETGRIDSASRRLLALTLRDLIEGDIPLGSRSGTGYGALTGRIISIEGRNAEEATNHVRILLSEFLTPTPLHEEELLRTTVPPAAAPANLRNNGTFHNPYHFVPVAQVRPTDTLSVESFEANASPLAVSVPTHLTHDRYVVGTANSPIYSGRILCRLENETEMVIGSRQTGTASPKTILPFEIGGRPAIPGSSLRGLISSTAEAASNSALRVLSNTAYSRRVAFRGEDKLDAIGLIVQSKDKKTWYVIPLALPAIPCDPQGGSATLAQASIFRKAALRVYLNGYQPDRSDRLHPKVRYSGNSFLESNRPNSKSADNQDIWYLQLHESTVSSDRDQLRVYAARPNVKTITSRNNSESYFLIGQYATNHPAIPISQAEFNRKTPAQQASYTRGVLRVLGIEGRETEIPEGKVHEVFIPLPDDLSSAPMFNVTEAVQRFHKLANQRTDTNPTLPFELKGSHRNADRARDPDAPNRNLELRGGDLVCFRAQNNRVEEVAVSSIWRRSVGDCYDFFKEVDPELLPFNGSRKSISIAEQMFGFVEQNLDDPTREVPNAKALAGRLRFAFGTMHDCPNTATNGIQSYYSEARPTTMKILSSPKPPSPSLYFKQAEGRDPVSKAALNPGVHWPMGRKFYLHHPAGAQWRTSRPAENVDQKVCVTPVRPHTGFYFHVDFDNLSERELGLLCYALRPTDEYRHKLGMGKPLGLGTVRIDPVAMLFVSRNDRYSAAEDSALSSRRYDFGWLSSREEADRLPSRYSRERKWIQDHLAEGQTLIHLQGPSAKSFGDLRDVFATRGNAAHRGILERIGNPRSVVAPVHYPLTLDQQGEGEGFKWFQANDAADRGERQQLQSVSPNQEALPTLRRNPGRP